MNRTRIALLVSSLLVVLLAVAPAAGAKTQAALPDLVVKKVSKPPKAKTVGTKLKLVVKVANTGEAKAGKSKLGLYLGKGKKHKKKDKRLKRVKVKPLAAGKSKKLKLRVTIPAKTKAGTYRLFACADDTKKVKEGKEGNCKATRKISLRAIAAAVPVPPPAPAFTLSDGWDWGYDVDAEDKGLEPGKPVTMTLTAANGIAGQAGYTRSNVGAEGFRSGNTATLDFSGPNNSEDDGQVTVQLPFAFPFGGVREQAVSVSTNGRISFGEPAWDYWNDTQPTDYRGIPFVVGELVRGIMPNWADLVVDDSGAGTGTVKQVVAPDGSWVAFQWEVSPLVPGGTPRRTFQLVLFPDGSFRFDYPGPNEPGSNRTFVGYSLGTGPGSVDIVTDNATAVPSSSLLFTPNALPAAGPSAAGIATAVLPKGSSFVSAGAGCTLTTAPGPFSTGLVTCPMPELGAGTQASQTVTFGAPDEAPGEHGIANFRLLGTYLSGGLKLVDGDEMDGITTDLRPSTIEIDSEYTGGNIEAGVPTSFEVEINSTAAALDEPTATFEVTNATISAVEISGEPIGCSGLGSSSAACALPSGTSGTNVELTVIPSSVNALTLKTTAQALNAPSTSISQGIFP
ncbi:MAG TPA: CARDB domain-containing protein [Solirubrobacterales bacterium]|nr:CARDB domain-containing protein [Solirubrobacterales bacterium]